MKGYIIYINRKSSVKHQSSYNTMLVKAWVNARSSLPPKNPELNLTRYIYYTQTILVLKPMNTVNMYVGVLDSQK